MANELEGPPSNDEINRAWTAAIESESIGGARAETMQTLMRIRNARTTWFGAEETDLRFAVDRYIKAKS